jgi:amino acid adenylation domain-containing protein
MRIGIRLRRSPEAVVAVLAVWKIGATYVPVNPFASADHTEFVLRHAAVELVITTSDLASPPQSFNLIFVDDLLEDGGSAASVSAIPIQGKDAAWILYTSGSTGRPKGVIGPHRALTSRCRWMWDAFPFEPGEVSVQNTHLTVVDSYWELWGSLAQGVPVVLPPHDAFRDPNRLVDILAAHRVTRICLVPSMLRAILDVVDALGERLSGIRLWVSSGENLDRALVERFYRHAPHAILLNQYGLTETCADVTSFDTRHLDAGGAGGVPIGRPMAGTRIHVVDDRLRSVPVGQVGELCVSGDSLAIGYDNDPDLTRKRFLPNPFAPEGGALLRTGDLVRDRGDGVLEHLGRVDRQVKVRGFRVEPEGIEMVLANHPAVSAVAVWPSETQETRLTASIVPSDPHKPPAMADLRNFVANRLPDHEVPAAFELVDRLPLTPSGKTDYAGLRQRTRLRAASPPEGGTAVERDLIKLWRDLLKIETVGLTDNFFEVGGNSLDLVRLLSVVAKTWRRRVSHVDFVRQPTVSRLARLVEAGVERTPARPPRPIDGDQSVWRKLSPTQERMWLQERRTDPHHPGQNNITLAFRLTGPLRIDALRAALDALVVAHDALRTKFAATEHGPRQRVVPEARHTLDLIDYSAAADAVIESVVIEAQRRHFDLEHPPLVNVRVARIAPAEHILVLTIHHLVCDGRSLRILLDDLACGYELATNGELIELRGSSVEEVSDEPEHAGQGDLGERLPPLRLMTDRPRPASSTGKGASYDFVIGSPLAARVSAAAKTLGVTEFVIWCGAVGLGLSTLTEQDRFELAVPVANRPDMDCERVIGCLMRTAAVAIDLSNNPTTGEYLRRIQDATWRAPMYDAGAEPYSTMFAYDDAHAQMFALTGLRVEPIAVGGDAAKLDLTILIDRGPNCFYGRVVFDPALYDEATVAALAERIRIAVDAFCDSNEARRLASLSLLSESESAHLASWNATERSSYPLGLCLHELVESRSALHPEARASCAGKTQTYAELDATANRLSRALLKRGLAPGDVVGVHLDRSLNLLTVVLAVLKAGGAYLPLQPDQPLERLTDYVTDAGARLIVTDQGREVWALSNVALPAPVMTLRELNAEAASTSAAPVPRIAEPCSIAYVIFTSGSTGRPKGVAVSHRSIVNRLTWLQETFPFADTDCLLLKTPMGADPSVEEIFWPLLSGARLEIAIPEGHRDPGYLAGTIISAGVTTIRFVPSMLGLFLDHPLAAECTSLKRIFSGGEPLPADLAARARRMLPIELYNFYGPTEATIDITWWPVKDDTPCDRLIPIGRPVANSEAFVLDRHQRLVPIGTPGELYLGGVQVASGYVGRPELTDEKFVRHPFRPDQRVYRTGDLVRWRRDGALEFLGRLDRQVQVAGVRVEPAEVEMALRAHPAVRDAVVVPEGDEQFTTALVAYVLMQGGARAEPRDLRRHLRARLPLMMIPANFIEIAEIPTLSNGKVDRNALRRVSNAPQRPHGVSDEVASSGQGLASVRQIWEQALRAPVEAGVGFVDAGGDSFTAIKVCLEVNRVLGTNVPVHALLECSSFENYLAQLEANLASGAASALSCGGDPQPAIASSIESFPTSLLQERWFELARQGRGHVDMLAEVRGPICPGLFSRAVSSLVDRHIVLRSRYESGRPPLQRVIPGWCPEANVMDLRGCDLKEKRARVIAAVERSLTAFDIEQEVPFDMELLLVEPERSLLVGRLHHIATDGWSTSIRLEDFERIYAELEAGRDPAMLSVPPQYDSYARAQRLFFASSRAEEARDYFRRTFAGATGPTRLPGLDVLKPRRAESTAYVNFVLPASEVAAITAYGRRRGSTLFNVLMSAFVLLLQDATKQSDLVFTTSLAGRNMPGTDRMLGVFVNPLPLRVHTGGAETLDGVHGLVHRAFLDLARRQDYVLADLVRHVPPFIGRDLHETSHIHLLFQNFPPPPRDGRRLYQVFDFQDITLERPFGVPIPSHSLLREFELIIFQRLDGTLSFNFGYWQSRFSEDIVRGWANAYRDLLGQAVGVGSSEGRV